MIQYGSYVVCKEYLDNVRIFLSDFFEQTHGKYNFNEWVSFEVPGADFVINLMKGDDQPLTQNMTFELYCGTKEELNNLATRHKTDVKSFLTGTPIKYRYHYVEIHGPRNICKIEINYIEDLG